MTEHDLKVAGDLGELKADVRTVKHDLAGIQQSLVLMSNKLDNVTQSHSKGLGFFAGIAFIITTFGGALVVLAKLVWAGKVGT